ncbi:hypothetical protein, partial [Providencia stuartii]|uniref:hypothetical protein n=1 Tax=Providencia stuartii TaxID=588 RepID=UPI001952E72B
FDFACDAPSPLITLLDIHPGRRQDLTEAHDLPALALSDQSMPVEQSLHEDQIGNLSRRITAPAGGLSLAGGGVIFDPGFPDTVAP